MVRATAVLTLLLGVVGIAAHQPLSALTGQSRGSGGSGLAGPLSALAGAFLVTGVAVLLALRLAVRIKQAEEAPRGEPPETRLWERIVLLVLPLVLAGLVTLAIVEAGRSHRSGGPAGIPQRPIGGDLRAPGSEGRTSNSQHTGWIVAGALGAAALLVSSAVFVRIRYAQPRAPESQRKQAVQLRADVERTLDDVESEPDPRRAVILAYSAMEAALSRAGIARKRSEAPREYLAHALGDLRVSGSAAETLTRLFERARFSRAAVDRHAREEALESLRLIRRDLGGAQS